MKEQTNPVTEPDTPQSLFNLGKQVKTGKVKRDLKCYDLAMCSKGNKCQQVCCSKACEKSAVVCSDKTCECVKSHDKFCRWTFPENVL